MILGTVPYLNVQPIIWALETGRLACPGLKIVPEVPRILAAELFEGRYDAAIVPVYESIRHPETYRYLNAPVIAARGAVYSVMLFSASPWEELHTIWLDRSSLTSVHLVQVLSAEKGLSIIFRDFGDQAMPALLSAGEGMVVIGDPAFAQHGRHAYAYDLALEWQAITALPFVFAAWLVPPGEHPAGMAAILIESLEIGLNCLEEVAKDSARRFGVTEEFALRYFTNNIHYELGPEELAGWQEFARLCFKHGLAKQPVTLRPYHD